MGTDDSGPHQTNLLTTSDDRDAIDHRARAGYKSRWAAAAAGFVVLFAMAWLFVRCTSGMELP